jgi:hypothetical protein
MLTLSMRRTVSYKPPTIFNASSDSLGPTDGGTPITLVRGCGEGGGEFERPDASDAQYGQDFGPAAPSPLPAPPASVVYGTGYRPNCTLITTEAPQRFECTTVEGAGKNLAWTAAVGGQNSSQVVLTSYLPPLIRTVFTPPSGFNTSGGEIISALGANFGPASAPIPRNFSLLFVSATASVSVPLTSCTVLNHSAFFCRSIAAAGVASLFITVAGQTNQANTTDTNSTLWYTAPVVAGTNLTSASVISTLGGPVVVVNGSNFGPAAPWMEQRLTVSLRDLPQITFTTACTMLAAQQSLSCPLPAGAGLDITVTVTIFLLRSNRFFTAARYAAPTVVSVLPAQISTTLGTPLTVRGTGSLPACPLPWVPMRACAVRVWAPRSGVADCHHELRPRRSPDVGADLLRDQ